MFGILAPSPDEARATLNVVVMRAPRPLATRLVTSGGTTLGLAFDAEAGADEGFFRAADTAACAIVSGSVGIDGEVLVRAEAAARLLTLSRNGGLDRTPEISGLFAAAIWQPERGYLTLLTDWIGGIHQLFYAQAEGAFVFGTDARAVVGSGVWSGVVNDAALDSYLDVGHGLPPDTLFAGVSRLPAGCVLTLRDGAVDLRRGFRLRLAPDEAGGDPARRLREAHRDAVARCIRSADEIGAFLSGGLDSSLNVAAMRELSDEPIHTFSVTYPGEEIDESAYARLVAERFDTEHHELALTSAAVLDELPEMVWALEEPAMDYSFIPTFNLARFARAQIPAVISGDGPDHLFGRHYPVALMRSTLGGVPGMPALAAALLPPEYRCPRGGLWRSLRRSGCGRLAWKALQSVACDPVQAYLSIYREIACRELLPESARSLLLRPEALPARNGRIDPLLLDHDGAQISEFERITALDLAIDGSCGVFAKVGKMAGYHGLIVREPYLDAGVRDLVETLPPRLKATGSVLDLLRGRLRRKVLLYEAARGVLPDEVLDRPKQGFRAPIGEWLREWIAGHDAARLLPALTRGVSLLDEARVNPLLAEHLEGHRDHGTLIMMLITLDLWYAIFVLGTARRPTWRWSDRLRG
ncbi:MAG: asparagine synthetase B family protein [Armatimonadota bacterium]|jgi:asparagine synthase (glutamine-hydrolysing)